MKKHLVLLAMSLAMLMSTAAQAQTTHMKVYVPFDFNAGNVQLPAGEYEVTALGPWGGSALSVQNLHSNVVSVVISDSCSSREAAADSRLLFHRIGQQYFLAEVWNQGSFAGSRIKINSLRMELAKNQSKDDVVLIASSK